MMCKFMTQDYGPWKAITQSKYFLILLTKEPIHRDASLVTMGVANALTKLLKYTGLSKPWLLMQM